MQILSVNCHSSFVMPRTVYQNWPFWVKTPITSTSGIARLYKLQGSFIILLSVYCKIVLLLFSVKPGGTPYFGLKAFCISYV